MKHLFKQLATVTLAALTLYAVPAFSSRPVGNNIMSGTLTSLAGGQQITIDGTVYRVKLTEPNLRQLQQLQVGQKVDVILSGPPGAATTQVVAIRVHPGA